MFMRSSGGSGSAVSATDFMGASEAPVRSLSTRFRRLRWPDSRGFGLRLFFYCGEHPGLHLSKLLDAEGCRKSTSVVSGESGSNRRRRASSTRVS
jgi:hypothetical protein